MPEPADAPTLNMGAVSRKTGISEHTLRAWERRYGLPRPRRTDGGHRLYSARDVELLTWLLAQQQAGVSIGQAVARWRQLESAGRLPALARTDPEAGRTAPVPHLDALREGWLRTCLAFDERGAEALLSEAFALYPAETVCIELLQRGLAAIGEGWYAGEISVQQEHFAAALSIRRIGAIIAGTSAPTRLQRILIGCAARDDHVFAPLLLTLLLRRRGWDVVFLGANVPVDGLEATLAIARPDLVVLSAEQLPGAASLHEAAQVARRLAVMLGYGGRVFNRLPRLRHRMPGHFLGQSLTEAVATIEDVIAHPRPVPPGVTPGADQGTALRHFEERCPFLERRLVGELGEAAAVARHLGTANAFLADRVVAALRLGDVGLIDDDLAWLEGLLERRGLPSGEFRAYLAAYRRIATVELDEQAHPLLRGLRGGMIE